ncbi:shikimate kinase [Agromyces sp. MMS24-JH15]|uniref:shikimate kinase n=1 Tax=Agromyces sp. MMS24-JH15 TaxID=3243765 RepID=UPI003747986F
MAEDPRLPLVLIGPMGAGKSRIGQRVAADWGVPFVDTDQRIVDRHGPIERIFADHGEPRFRELEREVVAEAFREHAVVSLGGGAVLDPATQADLADLPVVWLRVSPEAVASRLVGGTRPLLASGGLAEWRRIATEREPIYAALADLDIDTSRRSVARIVADITERFGGTR